jgi:hypothetical protein
MVKSGQNTIDMSTENYNNIKSIFIFKIVHVPLGKLGQNIY